MFYSWSWSLHDSQIKIIFFFFYLLLGFGAATSPEVSHFNSSPFKDTFLYFLYCIKLSPLVGSVLLEGF